jgi:hypothetical protein
MLMADFKGTIIINKESLDNKFENGRYLFFLHYMKERYRCVRENLKKSENYKHDLMMAYIDQDREALLRLIPCCEGVYDQFYNFDKEFYLQEKYSGPDGIYKFANDYPLFREVAFFPFVEDDYLFAIHTMGHFSPHIDYFIDLGLHYDDETGTSTDFTIHSMAQLAWETPWLEANGTFFWHKNDENKYTKEAAKEYFKWWF